MIKQNNIKNACLLWVEDDKVCLDFIAKDVSEQGYHIIIASGLKEAWQKLKIHGNTIDVAIIDIMMKPEPPFTQIETYGGRRSGLALARRMKEKYPKIQLIGTSQFSSNEVKTWFKNFGLGYLKKPYTAKKIIKLLNKYKSNNNPMFRQQRYPLKNIIVFVGLLASIITIVAFIKGC